MYIGYGKWFADTTALGKYLFECLVHLFLHEAISVSLFVRELGATTFIRLFGNMAGSFSNKNPLAEFIAGKDSVGTRNPTGKSWRDIIGTGYLDAGGGFGTDNVAADLLAIYNELTKIEAESVYVATGLAPLTANAEYPLLEVLVSGSVIYIYRYNHTSGNVPAAPDETTGRTEITH
ncbi:unnamed protein product, partial [marine sediment metagenome]